jgi:hypothetical protein
VPPFLPSASEGRFGPVLPVLALNLPWFGPLMHRFCLALIWADLAWLALIHPSLLCPESEPNPSRFPLTRSSSGPNSQVTKGRFAPNLHPLSGLNLGRFGPNTFR